MKNIAIKKAAINQLPQLQKIGIDTFLETFAADNTEKNMQDYLAKAFSLAQLKQELLDQNSEFYFALSAHQVIGYLKLNTGSSQTALREAQGLEIERIYVLKEFHGKKVGQLLYEKAIDIAKQKKYHYVWLGVWEKNPRAIQFYKKNGMQEFDKHTFTLGDDQQIDLMFKLPIVNQPKISN